MNIPKILDEKIAYKSSRTQIKKIKLQFGNSAPVEWEYMESFSSVNAVPLLPNGDVILVREWRPAWKQFILQIPGGNCTAKSESDRVRQIRKELQEEIGMDAKELKKLISCGAFAGIRKSFHIYLATNLFPSVIKKGVEDEHEYIDIVRMPLDEALDVFLSGREFTTAYTIIGLLLVSEQLRNQSKK